VAVGVERKLVAREARTRGPGGFSTLNANQGEGRRRVMGANTADASVFRLGAQTRLDWDGREDGRGPTREREEILPWLSRLPRPDASSASGPAATASVQADRMFLRLGL
jgi:hypothetical protein